MKDPGALPPFTSWLQDPVRGPARGQSELEDALTDYLMAQRPFSGGAHLGLVVVVLVLLWGLVPGLFLVGWASAIGRT